MLLVSFVKFLKINFRKKYISVTQSEIRVDVVSVLIWGGGGTR